ncbi:protein kinase domain-containing protein [Anabaena sp. CCY 0017]|uniref:protein kinase domain-containing protein n=1 Tax=Anabaena sp. CCY 0017 TaxID=3103866 RepID=UPI0039C75683
MQAPITVGSILQDRYRIIEILGQGEFGISYLAEDQRRFNELCSIKELISPTEADVWEKAQALFQQEAATLYQIEHSQVPKFREKFEQYQRLFLVEDYVAGKTYRTLLSQRLAAGQSFTEAEVLELIRSLLPVLEHIHSRGIIHRDISPENVILRDGDTKPVLIGFGVVKELATRLQFPNSTKPITSVGKLGFAPPEQMQTGETYPHSDLYALAVTGIVLLTGKEPIDLFDVTQLTWNWQRWIKVNAQFAQVINQMLNHSPGDRYQSAADVMEALQILSKPSIPTPELSQVQTIAVGRRPDSVSPPASPRKIEPIISSSRSSSILDSPLALGAIGSAVVILAGVGSWALVSSIRNGQNASPEVTPPQTFPSPIVTGEEETPTPEPTPEPTPAPVEPVIFSRRLILKASDTTTVEGTIKENQIIQYTFFGEEGAKLTTFIDQGSGILLTILNINQEPIEPNAQQVTSYEGILPITGRYIIQLIPQPEIAESDYSLNVALENPIIPTPTETPTPTPTPIPTPTETPFPTPTPPPIPQPDFSGENNTPTDSTPEL